MRRLVLLLAFLVAVLGFEGTARPESCDYRSCINEEIAPGVFLNSRTIPFEQCGMTTCGNLLDGGYLYETYFPLAYEDGGQLLPFNSPTIISASFDGGSYNITNEWYGDAYHSYQWFFGLLIISQVNGVSGTGTGYIERVTTFITSCRDYSTSDCTYSTESATSTQVTQFTPVPEPGTFSLLGSGVLALAGALRKKLATPDPR